MSFVDQLDAVFVLSLPGREDRRVRLLTHLEDVFGTGVLGKVIVVHPPQFDEPLGFVSVAVRSCLEGHLKIARRVQEARLGAVLVLEDDAVFGVDGMSVSELDAIANLVTCGAVTVGDVGMVTLGWLSMPDSSNSGGRFVGETIGAHAYLLFGGTVDRWVTHLETVAEGKGNDVLYGAMGPDGAANTLAWVNDGWVRKVVSPSLVGQRSSRSDITPKVWDRIPVLRELAGWWRG